MGQYHFGDRVEKLIQREGRFMRNSPSGAAMLVNLDCMQEPIWLPHSQCERHGNVFNIPEWLAIEKGII